MADNEVLELWERLDNVAHSYLAPIETAAQHQAALGFLETLWDKVNDDPKSPYGTLFRIVTDHIGTYEDVHFDLSDAEPRRILGHLMEQTGVTQKDVEQATGIYQANLSGILTGKRKLTTAQVKALAAYFHVDPNVLI